ncbi:efflux transporter outer membrane subunit [Altererythrobacter xixiisoli]|uniref:Efflux transporter outer membrane subunit n=1 Tax=Croceibacterium xixiisoli TaxID=1476466 RepID=A0A6I4TWY9_9SPHN|nr:efflux transporter outer membrane subunit [Croceibacterium xixiisoli]MXP00676.1 efflux transporter outer membrane subunit [Croceibacterium xixiisoli]
MSRPLVIAAALAALLAGCAPQIPDRPAAASVAAPSNWRTSFAGDPAVEGNWWSGFGDPQLATLVDQARTHNSDVAIAIARVEEARAQERTSRAVLVPAVNLTAPASYGRSLTALGTAVEATVAQPQFQASYEIDLFGRNRAQIDAAAANVLASDAARQTTLLAVSSATASGYVTLLALDERLDLLRQTLTSREEALRIARSRAAAGYTSQLELRQAEAEYHATQQQIPVVETAIARQENALSLLIGDTPAAIARGVRFAALHRPAVPAALPSELTRRRPDIVQAEYALAASDARLRAAQRQFLPQVQLSAAIGEVMGSSLRDNVDVWSIGGSILAPIFAGGRLRGQFDAATAQRDQAAFTYQRAVLSAFREVEDQLAIIARLDDQERALVAQRVAVADSLRHATNRYRAGYSPYLEQVDAQRVLLSVDIALIQLRTDRLTAAIALYQALGGSPST